MLRFCLLFLLVVDSHVFAKELLTQDDVSQVMQQIFAQHVDQKEMNEQAIKNAFKLYIDQFDPNRIYLLANEVSPYLQLPDNRVKTLLQQYQQNQFPAFEELNLTIQNAILRSRSIRQELEKNPTALFKDHFDIGLGSDTESDPDLKLPFAKSKEQLKERIQKYLVEFIKAEKDRYGVDVVMKNQPQTIKIFENNLISKENEYLYRNEQNVSLSQDQQQNLFTMHLLKALASGLDAHTTFYSPSEAMDLKTRLEKGVLGVGIIFKQRGDGSIVVSDISDGGPAAKSGLVKINDILVEVDGKKVAGESFDKVMELVQNNKNETLSLTLKHSDASLPSKISLKKQEIAVQEDRVDTSFRKIDDGIIGIITLHSFYQGANGVTSENDVRKALEDFKQKEKLRGLILDLRDNSGGFLNQAVKVAGLFITNGVIVISKYFNGEEHFYRDLDGKTYYEGPFVILTSRATASAAEIVAQALQDYGVALVVGDESTYGKGTIQNQNVTGKGNKGASLFKVTVGKYYTVSGKTPQLQGVKADIVVPGVFNYEHLGEQYLEFTVPNDKIPDEYVDRFVDVTPNLQAWYQRYYQPTLQPKTNLWQTMLPSLRADSAKRLSRNSDYQSFLDQARSGHPVTYVRKDSQGKSKPIDFQLDEGIEIIKEMIQLQLQERTKTIVNDVKNPIAEKAAFSYD
ncbi:MAG: tail-specific protease Tsp [Parachlamydiaceae bacterium]